MTAETPHPLIAAAQRVIDAHTASNRRPKAAVPIADLPRQLRIDADEMNGWGAGNEAEHARQAADEIERLQSVIAQAKAQQSLNHAMFGGGGTVG